MQYVYFVFNFITDFVISLQTLRSFYLVIAPLLEIPIESEPRNSSTKSLTILNNQILPLAYLECQDIRIFVPSTDLAESGAAHNIFIFQVNNNVSISFLLSFYYNKFSDS